MRSSNDNFKDSYGKQSGSISICDVDSYKDEDFKGSDQSWSGCAEDDPHTFDVVKIKKNIRFLSEYSHLKVSNLTKKYKESYEYIRNIIRFVKSLEEFNIILNIIKKQYRPTEIQPGTLAAFLFGCQQTHYGDICKSCSSLCIGSISPSRNKCKYQVWVNLNEKYIQTNNGESELESESSDMNSTNHKIRHAYVYVNTDFNGFTKDDIETFHKSGVEFAQIIITEKSQHHTLIKMTSIFSLPIKNNIEVIRPSEQIISWKYLNSPSKSNILIYILIVIIVVIVLFVLFNL
jgi:hypothetical protein